MKCPHCLLEINPDFKEVYLDKYEIGYCSIFYMKCPNQECSMPIIGLGTAANALRLSNGDLSILNNNPTYNQIYPAGSNRAPAPTEVDKPIAEDYNESCQVLPISPKASAALSRRCLQNIIRLKEGIKDKNLKLEIDALIAKNKLPSYITDNLNIIRGFGNIAAHGMEDQASGEILDIEPNEADFLLDILELLFDFYFVQPAKANKIKDALNLKLASAGQKTV